MSLSVIDCQECGFIHLSPLPSKEDQEALYQGFWENEKPGAKAIFDEDKRWRWRGYRNLLTQALKIVEPPLSVLDAGCGLGDFMEFMAYEPGWLVMGVDPDPDARKASGRWGPVWASLERCPSAKVISMSQVLEHVLDPKELLLQAHGKLQEGGCLILSVPNEFTGIQEWAARRIGRRWWIHRHHINYFSWETLERLLKDTGFQVEYRTTSFPMEVFHLLTDYTKSAATGRRLHGLRKAMERIGLWRLYPLLARKGLGRHLVVIARKRETPGPSSSA